jgi:hypothetical protein
MRKMIALVLLGGIAALVYSQVPEARRYLNMRAM